MATWEVFKKLMPNGLYPEFNHLTCLVARYGMEKGVKKFKEHMGI